MTPVLEASVETALAAWVESVEGDLVAPIEAQKFVAQMRELDPRGLADWLDAHAETIVCGRIGTIIRSTRAVAQQRTGARSFAAHVEAGDLEPLLNSRHHVECGDRRLRDMTADDIDFVAASYDASAKASRFEAAYLRAIKKRLPDRVTTVGDVLTEADIASLRFTKAH